MVRNVVAKVPGVQSPGFAMGFLVLLWVGTLAGEFLAISAGMMELWPFLLVMNVLTGFLLLLIRNDGRL